MPLVWSADVGVQNDVVLCIVCSYLQYTNPDAFYTYGWKKL